jgi:hypothetical protein
MLLLLLGIIVLHVAVLVLLFVSTIVSVSVTRAGGSSPGQQATLPPGKQPGRASPGLDWDVTAGNMKSQMSQAVFFFFL